MLNKFFFVVILTCNYLFSSDVFKIKIEPPDDIKETKSSPSSSSTKRDIRFTSSFSNNSDTSSPRTNFLNIPIIQIKAVQEAYSIDSLQDKASRDYPNLAKVEINRSGCFVKYFSVVDNKKEEILNEIYNLILNFEYKNDLDLIYEQFNDFSNEEIKRFNNKGFECTFNLKSKYDQLKARLAALRAEISVNDPILLTNNRNNNIAIVNQPRVNTKIIGLFCLCVIAGLIIALAVKYSNTKNAKETTNDGI